MNKDTFPKKALPLVPAFLASCALYTQFETWHSVAVCWPSLFRAESRKLFQQAAGWADLSPSPPACVWNHSVVPPSPARRCGHARLFITSLFPVTYYSSGQDGGQDVCGAMSNGSSLRAPNLSFGCCCCLTILSLQARGLLGRRADAPAEQEVTPMPTTMVPFVENLEPWRIKDL